MKGSKTTKTVNGDALSQEYTSALYSFLEGDGEVALRRAYEFGRAALIDGLDLLHIVILHHQALEQGMSSRGRGNPLQKVRMAGEFLTECLSSYEMAFRGFKERNAALRHINDALEQESRRIALLLHDEVGQSLFAAELALSDLEERVDPSQRKNVRKVTDVINQIEGQMRSLSHEMRPTILEDLGLVPALEFLAQGISKRHRIAVNVRSSVRNRLEPSVEATLFRIVQEALSNVIRHSNAARAQVTLEYEGKNLVCIVSDSGTGFDATSPHGVRDGLGLTGIRERLDSIGGEFKIQSRPGQGTRLIMRIPSEV